MKLFFFQETSIKDDEKLDEKDGLTPNSEILFNPNVLTEFKLAGAPEVLSLSPFHLFENSTYIIVKEEILIILAKSILYVSNSDDSKSVPHLHRHLTTIAPLSLALVRLLKNSSYKWTNYSFLQVFVSLLTGRN